MMVFCMFTGDKSVLRHGNSGRREKETIKNTVYEERGGWMPVALRFSPVPSFLITCSNFSCLNSNTFSSRSTFLFRLVVGWMWDMNALQGKAVE